MFGKSNLQTMVSDVVLVVGYELRTDDPPTSSLFDLLDLAGGVEVPVVASIPDGLSPGAS